ncbi:uncharacterized protein HaLaN_27866 [Haematococcus lacustris]|uniref:Uncharacterized protein n=1 Tax=Haematococcus lacustris TaxID=44745 RepID=A0A6A0A9Y3_HAELA|nr:uncharacterized protein HaLaN_27866 [Haematococcus lacustris]
MEALALDNGAKSSFSLLMVIIWILFGVLAVARVSLLQLWMTMGVATVVIGFWLLGPLNKYHDTGTE